MIHGLRVKILFLEHEQNVIFSISDFNEPLPNRNNLRSRILDKRNSGRQGGAVFL